MTAAKDAVLHTRTSTRADVLQALAESDGPLVVDEIVGRVFWGVRAVRDALKHLSRGDDPLVTRVGRNWSPQLWAITDTGRECV